MRWVILFLGLLSASPLAAQTVVIAEATRVGNLVESYDPAADVAAGSPLVGLRLGGAAGTLQLDHVLLIRPPSFDEWICLETTTQDGRYNGHARYEVTGSNPDAALVQVRPITELQGTMRQQLEQYDPATYAVRAFATRDETCSPSGAVHLPSVAEPGAVGGNLVVTVNGRAMSGSAELRGIAGGEPIASAECDRAGGGSLIAFDLTCELPLDGAPDGLGAADLALIFDDGFGETTYTYKVFLP
ncbi:hypothetical protein L1787_23685 [Acuticoccus sp. M5D2P5]|uniref:hypothetical protein n=1 Tax=Acuticoccus kalidii TaxID=2910977 RepID=UPI001F2B259D|nr:hypothetical protein [Acuticoccus kalidii]MCF3936399.1 hypothetical protein [Acuticoccus kalidii]